MKPKRKRGWWFGIGCIVAIVLIVAAMVVLAFYARKAGTTLKGLIAEGGPPITAAQLPQVLGEIPVPPDWVFDAETTNSPTTRIVVGLGMKHKRLGRVMVFQSQGSVEDAVQWYTNNAPGWKLQPRPTKHGPRSESDEMKVFRFTSPGSDFALVSLSQIEDRIIMALFL